MIVACLQELGLLESLCFFKICKHLTSFGPEEDDADGLGSMPYLNGHSHDFSHHPASLRGDGYGGGGTIKYSPLHSPTANIQSHNYEPDESEVWRAYVSQVHFLNRGQWWTTGKKRSLKRWILTFLVGVIQAFVAALCNFSSRGLSKYKYEWVYGLLNPAEESVAERDADDDLTNIVQEDEDVTGTSSDAGYTGGISAFWAFCLCQTAFAAIASIFVWIEPGAPDRTRNRPQRKTWPASGCLVA